MIYKISGMHCASCAASIERAVKKVPGVESVTVSLILKTMDAEGGDEAEIIRVVKKLGYEIDLDNISTPLSFTSKKQIKEHDNEKIRILKLIFSAVFLAAIIALGKKNTLINALLEAVLTCAVIAINFHYYISAARSLCARAPNMDCLISFGSGIGFVWSISSIILTILTIEARDVNSFLIRCLNTPVTRALYFHSTAMILTFVSIGKVLESHATKKTRSALDALIRLTPKTATVLKNGVRTAIPLEELKKGDIFLAIKGDAISTDSIILEGEVKVDESMLTGESDPIIKKEGDFVTGGTIILDAKTDTLLKAESVGRDTVLMGIITAVKKASASKAPVERVADRAAGIFTPVVIVLSLIVFILWVAITKSLDSALTRAISTLVVSCPCALGLATPAAIMASSGRAAKDGVLFRSAEALEQLGKIKIAALDKTGTITRGVVGADTARPDSAAAIKELKALSITPVLISGDKKNIAEKIGREVGISRIYSAVSIDGKADIIRGLKSEGLVAMTGDGINDAVALTAADVGVSISSARDVAVSSSSVILLRDSLMQLVYGVKLSKKTLKIIKENLFWAVFYNALMIPLAAGVFYPWGVALRPGLSACAMSLSSLCVVLNALRLGKKIE